VTASFGEDDVRFMRRALRLAARGAGTTRPNPMVGAVVVRAGRVLAEGFHRRPGGPHAEIEALSRLDGRAPGATMYVSLEPCAHTGRTPPCTTALLSSGIARVVIGVRDPNPLVNGRGIAKLRRAGIKVDVGCLEGESRAINRAFFIWVTERRPLVTLKVAATWDGFIADGRPRPVAAPAWLTGPGARAAAHAMRAAHDAVLVGAGTIRADDPRLTDRRPVGGRARAASGGPSRRQPLRVVLDGRLSSPPDAAVFRSAADAQTLVVVGTGASAARSKALRAAGVEVAALPTVGGRFDIREALALLAARDVQSVLVEGGAVVHGSFVAAGVVDRVALFLAPRLLGGGIAIAAGAGRSLADALKLGPPRLRRLGDDILMEADVVSS